MKTKINLFILSLFLGLLLGRSKLNGFISIDVLESKQGHRFLVLGSNEGQENPIKITLSNVVSTINNIYNKHIIIEAVYKDLFKSLLSLIVIQNKCFYPSQKKVRCFIEETITIDTSKYEIDNFECKSCLPCKKNCDYKNCSYLDEKFIADIMTSQVPKTSQEKENKSKLKTILILQLSTAKAAVKFLEKFGYKIIYSENFTDISKKYSTTVDQILNAIANASQKFFIDNPLEDLIIAYQFGELAPRFCSYCNQIETDKIQLKACGGCKQEFYCDEECQKNHWKEHKISCNSSK